MRDLGQRGDVAVGLRERKREQTRRQIVDAAFELFGRHGFTDTTVEMIADAAFVSPRTVYRYFSAKDAIVFTELEGEIERIAARVRDHCADGVTMRGLLAAFADHFGQRQHEGWFSTMASLVRESPALRNQADAWRRELVGHLAGDIADARGAATPDVADRAMAATAVAVAAVSLTEWVGASPRRDVSDVVMRAGDLVADNWDQPNR